MKKVLIITYYWPPAGGPGVQRVLKFAKYLPEFGWQPIILTVQNGEYPAYDESLFSDIPKECKVYKTPAIEPFSLYKKFTGMGSDEAIPVAALTEKKNSWKKEFAHWIRLNLFIPDAKIGWIPFAVKAGKHIIRNEKPNIIFSSSPPPTVHLIAKKLAKWSGIKWVADFRDPWTEIYYYQTSNKKRNNLRLKIDKMLEMKALLNADKITAVGETMLNLFTSKCNDILNENKFFTIENGFDKDDFKNLSNEKFERFTLLWAGNMNKTQNAPALFEALKDLLMTKKIDKNKILLKFVGDIAPEIVQTINKSELKDIFEIKNYLPHNKIVKLMKKAHILLLIIGNLKGNKFILQGKLFEYLASNNPILAYGYINGDAHQILNRTNAGSLFDYNDVTNTEDFILKYYNLWLKNKKKDDFNFGEIEKFSRKSLTKRLVKIFEKQKGKL